MPSSQPLVHIISKSTLFPSTKSTLSHLKLSVSDLPMLSCHYIQKGNLFNRPPISISNSDLLFLLKCGLSRALTHFPPLAGRLTTDSDGYVYITCNDAGVEFVHANAVHLSITDITSPLHVPDSVKGFFAFDRTVSYDGHFKPILAVQVTELKDGVFIGFSVNHAVVDGTSLWNFINTYAEVCRGAKLVSKQPSFVRDSVLISSACLRLPAGGPKVTFDENAPLSERIFSFSRESILKLKDRTNNRKRMIFYGNSEINTDELLGKQRNDRITHSDDIGNWIRSDVALKPEPVPEISSFQSLCALLWRAVTRARKFPNSKTTTFRMAVNCRHRLKPELETFYFGNAIQSIPTYATAGDVLSHDLKWCAEQLNKNVLSHDHTMVCGYVKNWESDPRCFPLGNFDGAMLTMGSSPRFPMFDNDFGWGKPVAVRSGRANKFDGKISAFPGREGGGSVDLEVVLSPETMAGIESDPEFMQYVWDKC
ncbi:protein ENHANCED PSEUDOMONAS SUSCEPTIBILTY 1 [Cynara cardunculus var. scolymus]|uniref:Chloramphenicol acetyltransferase-like domain-containing protein n=1 Tax=Cynara cardunculus var. scolymus TaxID=59895 RepID=A0A103YDB6_CYNCS|nr:protein ENHANCED PSEUDOMONAS SUSCEPTIBILTY 1 [Cynara cardunculus var. scolymus]KVI07002.1 Chloramphenicol acetyltransferase-like domain-containing protein [Cynara cardunculus var. scolymus]